MTIIEHQNLFLLDAARLILKSQELGFVVTAGELFRTPEQQKIYVESGLSKTFNSMHLKRLALDLNVFKGGNSCSIDEIKPLGIYWESLNPLNRWGGNFTTIKDGPHFERFC